MWKNRRPFTECIPHFCGKLSAPAKPSGGGGRAVKTLRTKGQKTLYRMHPHTERGRDPETGVSSVKGEKHGIIRQENEATSGPSRNRSLYISTGEMSL